MGASPPAAERLPLWPGHAPIGEGRTEAADVFITVYRPAADIANGAAIVICPGGGYSQRAIEPEGNGIARWLAQHGITGIVLEYRLPAGRPFVPLLDAQRAMRMVRANAKKWNIASNRIGIMGFSAGGHLAATTGTHFDGGDINATNCIDRMGCRPDFMALIYPVITMGEKTHAGSKRNLLGQDPTPEMVALFSNEKHITNQTPPTFLAHAQDDIAVSPDNSRIFYESLKDHKVATEYLQLPSGDHGLDGYQGPMWDTWQVKFLEWLATHHFTR